MSAAGRHDALRHSRATGCRGRCSTPRSPGSARPRGGRSSSTRRWLDLAATITEESYDAVFLAVGAQVGKRAYIPAGSASRVLDAVLDPARPRRRANAHSSVGQWRCTAAATRRSTPPARPSASGPRTRWWSTGVPETGCPPTRSRCARRAEEGILFRWLSTIDQDRRREGSTVEQMELDDTGFPQPTGRYEELPAESVVLALGQDCDLQMGGQLSRDSTVEEGSRAGGCVAHDRPSEASLPEVTLCLAGVRSTVAMGQGRQAASSHRQVAGRDEPPSPKPVRKVAEFDLPQHLVLHRCPSHAPAASSRLRDGESTFDEVVQGLDAGGPLCWEARRCMSCGSCFSCDNSSTVCPDNAVIKVGPAVRVRHRSRLLQGVRPLRVGVSGGRDPDVSRGDLAEPGRHAAASGGQSQAYAPASAWPQLAPSTGSNTTTGVSVDRPPA